MVQVVSDPSRGTVRKRKILSAAAALFRERGVEGTGMRDIASALGMTAGNLYYYFHNKAELIAFCQQEALEGLLRIADRALEGTGSPRERLRELMTDHVVLVLRDTPGSLAHLDVGSLSPTWRSTLQVRRDEYEQAIRSLVESGIERGEFRSVDPGIVTRSILGALNWTLRWFDPRGPGSAEEVGAEIAELLVRGLDRLPADPPATGVDHER